MHNFPKSAFDSNGQVTIWDVNKKEYIKAWAVDARELIAVGSATETGPENAPRPVESNPGKIAKPEKKLDFNAMGMAQLHEHVKKAGLQGLEKAPKAELVKALTESGYEPE